MNINGRLKLGPKRREGSGFNRIHKLHQDTHDKQQLTEVKGLCVVTNQVNQQNNDPEPCPLSHRSHQKQHAHQINLTQVNVLGKRKEENGEHSGMTERTYVSNCNQLNEFRSKCQQLQTKVAILQQKNNSIQAEAQQKYESMSSIFNAREQQLKDKLEKLAHQNQKLKVKDDIMNKNKEECLQTADKQYYQKQLSRLKSQIQDLQIQTAQTKYQLISQKQENQQKDQIIKNKIQDNKNIQTQLDRQKINIAELRSQYHQKQRGLRVALEESEANNQLLCHNVEQINRQLEREESARKDKSNIVDSLQKQIDVLVSRGRDSENKCNQMRKNYQEQITIHSRKLFDAESAQRNTFRQSQSVIQKLSSDLESLKAQQIQQMSASKTQGSLRKEEQEVERELKIVRLEEQMKQCRIGLEKKDEIIVDLQNKLKTYFSPQQYMGLQRRCKELEQKRLNSARYYEQKLFNYQKENQQLRLDKINKTTSSSESSGFDQVVKNTLEESQILRTQLKRVNDLLIQTKQQANDMRMKEKGYLNDLQILRRKTESQSKNFGIQLEVQKQKLINQIDSLKRRLSTVQTRLQYKVTQNKQKDEFIKSVIVGRSEPIDRRAITAELQRIFQLKDKKEKSQSDES